MRRVLVVLALALAAAAGPAAAPADAAKRSVPRGFYGAIYAGTVERAPNEVQGRVWDRLAAAGVESARVVLSWSSAQPTRGGPIDWGRMDRLVESAAVRRISLMPTLISPPAWAKLYPDVLQSPPARASDYAAFLAEAVRRYGAGGTFWSERPEVGRSPVRYWQVWNEPELTDAWWREDRPWLPSEAKRYGALVRASRRAARKVDPGARIVLGGLTNFAWETLAGLYRHAGIRGHFDVAAVHMFPGNWRSTETIVRRFRSTLDRNGDRKKPIWVTEMTWPAAEGRAEVPSWANTPYYRNFVTTDRGAASRLSNAYALLSRRRFRQAMRLERVHWYLATSPFSGNVIWDYSGLMQLDGSSIVQKPAYSAYRASAKSRQGCKKDARGRCR
ncbi:MAG TPA: hypothetical protein VF520_06580 [Thermoleophilaceae bacterium]|jgi:hypothetical protein